MWKTFLSVDFRKDPSTFFLSYQLHFNEQRPEKAGGGETKGSLQKGHLKSFLTAGKRRSQDMKGKDRDDPD